MGEAEFVVFDGEIANEIMELFKIKPSERVCHYCHKKINSENLSGIMPSKVKGKPILFCKDITCMVQYITETEKEVKKR